MGARSTQYHFLIVSSYLIIAILISGCVYKVQHQQTAESIESTDSGLIYGDFFYELHPKYHPGDFYTLDQEMIYEYRTNLKGILTEALLDDLFYYDGGYQLASHMSFWKECKNNCKKECVPEFTCEGKPPLSGEYSLCKKKYEDAFRICNEICIKTCMHEKYKSTSIARHIKGGKYSDGSYYEHSVGNFAYFNNVHPEADKYKKTKWQKDRDECMELTYENEEKKFEWFEGKYTKIKRIVTYYQNCLKERGYSLK